MTVAALLSTKPLVIALFASVADCAVSCIWPENAFAPAMVATASSHVPSHVLRFAKLSFFSPNAGVVDWSSTANASLSAASSIAPMSPAVEIFGPNAAAVSSPVLVPELIPVMSLRNAIVAEPPTISGINNEGVASLCIALPTLSTESPPVIRKLSAVVRRPPEAYVATANPPTNSPVVVMETGVAVPSPKHSVTGVLGCSVLPSPCICMSQV